MDFSGRGVRGRLRRLALSFVVAVAAVLGCQLAICAGLLQSSTVTPCTPEAMKLGEIGLEVLTAWLVAAAVIEGGAGAAILTVLFVACEVAIAALLDCPVGTYEFVCIVGFPASYALIPLLRPRGGGWARLVRVPFALVATLASLQYGVYIAYIVRFGGHPSPMAIMTTIGTNPGEAGNFIVEQFGIPYVLVGVAIFAVLLGASLTVPRRYPPRDRALLCLLWVAITAIAWGYRSKADSYNALVFDLKYGVQAIREIRRGAEFYRDHSEEVERANPTKRGHGEVSLVVIGESANRNHWGSYGYPRDTTPLFGENPEVVLLGNAYSCMTHTDPVVVTALSRMNSYGAPLEKDENPILKIAATMTLPEVLRAAGVHTRWFSSHTRAGVYDKYIYSLIVRHFDDSIYTCEAQALRQFRQYPDDAELLDLLQEALDAASPDEDYVIFLHIIGSHWVYADRPPTDWPSLPRYPEYCKLPVEYRNRINCYDRSINYTDWILERCVEILKASKFPVSSMLYFSDHSEDVLGDGHNFDALTPAMTEIPAAFWCSEGYRSRWPETVGTIEEGRDRVFTDDLAFEFILGINHVECEGLDERFQFTSPAYAVTSESARFWGGRPLKEVVPGLGE